ncbi:MAG: Lrp/AsnC family transcriptional regulator [Albidovulum sp.]
MPEVELADTDRKILRLLQKDARASTQDLAAAAGLSTSPAWRRLKRLEDLGIIRGQVALLDARKLGLGALAYVQVSLTDHSEATVARFDSFVTGQPQILECARVTGAFDYILKVVTKDAEDLETFLMHHLLALGIVRTTSTSFVLRQTKSTTELPLDYCVSRYT